MPRARLHDSRIDIKGAGKSVSVVVWAIRHKSNSGDVSPAVPADSRSVGFTGWIGGVAVFNRALSAEEMMNLAVTAKSAPIPNRSRISR